MISTTEEDNSFPESAQQEEQNIVEDEFMQRSNSLPNLNESPYPDLHTASDIHRPGGFRRSFLDTLRNGQHMFFSLYDRRAVYDSSDDEDSSSETDACRYSTDMVEGEEPRRRVAGATQDARHLSGVGKTLLTLFKSFFATGILFLPRGFLSAGLVAGSVAILAIGALNLYAMLLLLKGREFSETAPESTADPLLRRQTKRTTFASLAELALGRLGGNLAKMSIMFSQLGFCCVYLGFLARILSSTWPRAHWSETAPPGWIFILGTVPVVVPFSLIRHLKYFALPNLLADGFVLLTVLYVIGRAVYVSTASPLQPWSCDDPEVPHGLQACFGIQPRSFLMFLGTSVYTFEGTAMIIPIQSAMQNPETLPRILTLSMIAITLTFTVFGATSFYAYRSDTHDIILQNLPDTGYFVVTAMFSVVAVLMFPLMLFPASQIVERRFFKKERRSGKKWQKNFTRMSIVMFCVIISAVGEKSINSMVSLIGGLFCVPLALIFPALIYLRLGEGRLSFWTERLPATLLAVFGSCTMVLSTFTAIKEWQ